MSKDFSAEQIVRGLYASILQREPDDVGLAHHVDRLQTDGVSSVVGDFIKSVEFIRRANASDNPASRLNFEAAMPLSLEVSPAQLGQMWEHIEQVWSGFGEERALWSVITKEDLYDSDKISATRVEEFYESGSIDLRYLEAYASRAGVSIASDAIVSEYGCGVGRTTCHLAKRFGHVHGFDVSQPHLRLAGQRLADRDIPNVTLHHVNGRGKLEDLKDFDLFFSIIVLQHSPPPIIMSILEQAFSGLRVGGYAFFQVPTYSKNYSFSPSAYLSGEALRQEMEIHYVPQAEIFSLASRWGLIPLEVRQDHCIGNYAETVSCTYLLQKKD